MSRIFITGSADGLGQMAARLLVAAGHQVVLHALEPGWVATKMGGPGAPDDLQAAPKTQVWLAVSDEPEATVSGAYFYHMKRCETHPAVHDVAVQERLIEACAGFSGIRLPD